jgi:hypothetical protein
MTFSLRRAGKWVAVVAITASVFTGVARFALNRYLASARGKSMVADRLGAALGMPVEVSEVDVGDSSASFRFRVMDPANPKSEVLAVRSASTDVSVTELVSGRVAPSALRLDGVALTLRLDTDGRVLTPLPAIPGASSSLPAVAVEDGRIYLKQTGRPAFTVNGVSLRVEPKGEWVVISGRVDDPRWGEWTIRGEIRRDRRSGWVELTSDDAPLDSDLLATIPLAPRDLFDEVKDTGRAAVTIRLTLGTGNVVWPLVEIRPTRTLLGIPLFAPLRLYGGDSDRFLMEPLR